MCLGISALLKERRDISNIVIATYHEDVLQWLNPTWVFHSDTGELEFPDEIDTSTQVEVRPFVRSGSALLESCIPMLLPGSFKIKIHSPPNSQRVPVCRSCKGADGAVVKRVRTKGNAEGAEGQKGTDKGRCRVTSDWSFVSGNSDSTVAQKDLHCHTCRKEFAERFLVQINVLVMQRKLDPFSDNLVS